MKTYFSSSELDMRTVSDQELINAIDSKKEYSNFESFVKSLAPGKRKLILSAIELYRRELQGRMGKFSACSSKDVYRYMKYTFGDSEAEEFWILYLNQANGIISKMRVSVGGISETSVDIRLILRHALINKASGIIICHNHPSGNCMPSDSDDKFTQKLKTAAKYMDIRLLDHVIITLDKYFSYSSEGRL